MQIDFPAARKFLAILTIWLLSNGLWANDFESFLKPIFTQSCYKCHGGDKVKGKINIKEISNLQELMSKPSMIEEIIDVVDSMDMPPEDEPALTDVDRDRMVSSLKNILKASTKNETAKSSKLRRLNRFQYNNAIKDLFDLKLDVFNLQEKLMTRHENYVLEKQMPETVK